MLIGLGALVNISVGGWLGALLFATGLLTICINKYQLVTGQFYRMYRDKNILFNLSEILLIFICNLLGVLVIAIITKLLKLDCSMAQEIILARQARIWYEHILAGILCGICIQIAVQSYQKERDNLSVILPVMVFILIKSEHCIADFFYYLVCKQIPFNYILCVFLGNFIGASLILLCNVDSPHSVLLRNKSLYHPKHIDN